MTQDEMAGTAEELDPPANDLPTDDAARPLIDDPEDRPSDRVRAFFPEFFPEGVKHSIPLKQIRHGGPPKDGIPALTRPETLPALQAAYLRDDDRVLGITVRQESRAYPIRILNWHEIVNDVVGGQPVVVTYCPLCGTGISFQSAVGGQILEFGVSDMLYNSDLLMYDRHTETPSLWAQALGEAVVGPRTGTRLRLLPLTLTTWSAWKRAHPETSVLSLNTGFARDYTRDPYAGYAQNPGLFFPVEQQDERLHPKELVLGLRFGESTKAYVLKSLQREQVVNDTVAGESILLLTEPGSEGVRVYLSQGHRFQGSADAPIEIGNGHRWDVSEEALIHPETGKRLERYADAFVSFWFGWFTFYPDTQLWQ